MEVAVNKADSDRFSFSQYCTASTGTVKVRGDQTFGRLENSLPSFTSLGLWKVKRLDVWTE